MKSLKVLSLAVSLLVSSSVFADPNAPVACASAASSAGWNVEATMRLCGGATSNAPVACAAKASSAGWNAEAVVRLCAGATN